MRFWYPLLEERSRSADQLNILALRSQQWKYRVTSKRSTARSVSATSERTGYTFVAGLRVGSVPSSTARSLPSSTGKSRIQAGQQKPACSLSRYTTLTRIPASHGSGVYSYLEPSLADRWAVSTMSSRYRVMLACEVVLLPHNVKPPKSSGILQSVSHSMRPFVSRSHTDTTNRSTRKVRLSSCQGPKRSHPSFSYCTQRQKPRPPNPQKSTGHLPTSSVPLSTYPDAACRFIV